MAHGLTHATLLRTDIANLVTGGASITYSPGTNQQLIIFSGTPPTNAGTALAGNTAIATITGLSWGAGSGGVATITGSTPDSNAVGGTATFFRITKSDGTTAITQGTVGTSGADLNLNNLTINAGANVSLSSGTYTAPN